MPEAPSSFLRSSSSVTPAMTIAPRALHHVRTPVIFSHFRRTVATPAESDD
ncbi:hypothetical protein [Amycolatopsis sp. NPDC003731]